MKWDQVGQVGHGISTALNSIKCLVVPLTECALSFFRLELVWRTYRCTLCNRIIIFPSLSNPTVDMKRRYKSESDTFEVANCTRSTSLKPDNKHCIEC